MRNYPAFGRNRYKAYRGDKAGTSLFLERIKDSSPRHKMGSLLSFHKKKRISLTEEEWDYRDQYIRDAHFLKQGNTPEEPSPAWADVK